ncbi:hypothetical protein HR060_17790 [Catenovulum sp. SM1970]|uniref:hypothetical protein n=1 Tax=Marinifaba aquimaris TaxID=2741323 RepID=UPI001572DF64|nr:hypothetical protein [Marinifaba aquimaris]NTS78698.1 hypothetical protein [Marinifaba aquimaris]
MSNVIYFEPPESAFSPLQLTYQDDSLCVGVIGGLKNKLIVDQSDTWFQKCLIDTRVKQGVPIKNDHCGVMTFLGFSGCYPVNNNFVIVAMLTLIPEQDIPFIENSQPDLVISPIHKIFIGGGYQFFDDNSMYFLACEKSSREGYIKCCRYDRVNEKLLPPVFVHHSKLHRVNGQEQDNALIEYGFLTR